jgi:L-ascorbate metabolism protein UlaG (beta-lactamase superfamily)
MARDRLEGSLMRVTKFPQSCLLLEKAGGRIVIDPGSITMARHDLDEFGDIQAVLYTHRHHDHFDEHYVDALLERGVALYGNADLCSLVDPMNEVKDGQSLEVASFRIEPRDLPHVPMVNGSAGPPNTGFFVDGRLFHPGDGIELEGLRARVLALPIAGPSISFRDAYVFTERTRADIVVPIHYDFFIAEPETFAKYCDIAEVVALKPGASYEFE